MKLSDRIDAVDQAYQRLMRLYQQGGTHPVQAEVFQVALHNLNVVLEELRTAYEELEQKNQALLDYHQILEAERQRYQELFNLAPDGYLVTNSTGLIQEANVAISTMLQVGQKYLIGKPLLLFFSKKDHLFIYSTLANLNQKTASNHPLPQTWDTELCPRQGPSMPVAITLSCTRQLDGTVIRLRWLIRDITVKKQAEEKIHRQAFYDALTDLPNRAFLDTYLPKALAQAARQSTRLAVAFLDLDRFKGINDTLGHGVGDALLQQVGRRLQDCLREADLLVRWGGDEFIVVLTAIGTMEDVGHTCDRIIASLQPVFSVNHHQLHISTSFGVAFFPDDGEDPATLLHHADQALYDAKNRGRNSYCFYRSPAP